MRREQASPKKDANDLRRRAEDWLIEKRKGQGVASGDRITAEDLPRVVQELQIHQIELEIQNEELRQRQAELEAARVRYFDLYDLAPIGYCTVSEQGIILEANLTAANLLGVARGALINQSISRFILPEDQDIYYVHRKQFLQSGDPQAFDLRMVKKDGVQFWARLVANAAQDATSELLCHIAISDITGSKLAESLRIEKEGFSQALDGIDALVYVADMKTYEIVFINAYGKSMWGDIKGKICWQTIQAGQAGPCDFCTNSKLIESDGKPTEGVVWEFQNTVNKRWYDCRDRCIYWPDGRIVRIEIATDITNHKRAEEELAYKTMHLEAQSETSIDGILAVDNEGHVILANKRFGEIWGFPKDILDSKDDKTLLEFSLKQLKFPEEFNHKVAYLYEHQDEKSRDEVEFVDGRYFDRYSSPMQSTDGKYLGRIWFFRDITERKRAEEQLIKREQELQAKTINLEELNIALKVLLEHREKDKDELQDNIMANVQQLVVPLFEKLKVCPLGGKEAAYVNALEYAWQNITAPFVNRLAHKTRNFTPKEIQVASLIKDGQSTKAIADILNLSIRAIDFHRDNIRKKLGLNKKTTNLRSYLMSLS